MSLLKAIKAQLGLSNTPANNFVITAEADNGTMKLARGNAGATTQDILTVDANGRVAMPRNVIAFRGNITNAPLPTGSFVNPTLTEIYDAGGFYNPIGSKFQPTVAGYYQFNLFFELASSAPMLCAIYLNGGLFAKSTHGPSMISSTVSCCTYLNGSNDYIEAVVYQTSGAQINCNIEFNGLMIAKA